MKLFSKKILLFSIICETFLLQASKEPYVNPSAKIKKTKVRESQFFPENLLLKKIKNNRFSKELKDQNTQSQFFPETTFYFPNKKVLKYCS